MKTPTLCLNALSLLIAIAVPIAAHADVPHIVEAMQRLQGTYRLSTVPKQSNCESNYTIATSLSNGHLDYTVSTEYCGENRPCARIALASQKDPDVNVVYGTSRSTGAPYLQLSSSGFDHGGDGFNGDIIGWTKEQTRYVQSADGKHLSVTHSTRSLGLMTYSDTGGEHFIQNDKNSSVCFYDKTTE